MGFSDQFGAPIPKPEGSSGSRDVKGTTRYDKKVESEMGPFSILAVSGIWGEGMESRPFQAGLFQKVIGVSWGGLGFLAITSSGVFTSTDGEEWGKVAAGFSATGVAYGRKVWVAINEGSTKISKDKGKTWKAGGSAGESEDIVFAGPSPKKDAKEEEGAFYALDFGGGPNGEVYTSTDGVSWSKALVLDEWVDGPGILGYTLDGIGTQGSDVVVTGTQWIEVPPSDTAFGLYTRATKWTGSNGGIGGPSVYGPDGNANVDGASTNAGAGAAGSRDFKGEEGATFISYKKTDGISFGTAVDNIFVNGASIATSTFHASSGTRVNGLICMSAANGECWGVAGEVQVSPGDLDVTYFFMSASGARSPSVPFQEGGNFGATCALAIDAQSAVFCGVLTMGSGGVWTNTGGGWSVALSASGKAAVGVGKIAKGKKESGGGGDGGGGDDGGDDEG